MYAASGLLQQEKLCNMHKTTKYKRNQHRVAHCSEKINTVFIITQKERKDRMRTHYLKILQGAADLIVSGEKTFELRENDRFYQKGDAVHFTAVDREYKPLSIHPVNQKYYEITCVVHGYGLKDGYVVFGIKEKELEI